MATGAPCPNRLRPYRSLNSHDIQVRVDTENGPLMSPYADLTLLGWV